MMDMPPLIFIGAALMLLGNLVLRVVGNNKKAQFAFNCVALLIISLLLVYELFFGTTASMLNFISINPFSLFFAMLFAVGFLLINLIAFAYSEEYADFTIIASFSLIGLFAVAFANSLITIFIGLELATLPIVFLILLSKRGLEAAAKLFIMAAVAIALLSFAIVLIYGANNTFALHSYPQSAILSFAALLAIAAMGFEASIFPFNVLIPDIYTGAPAYLAAMLGGVNKKVGFVALMQILILIFLTNRQLFIFVAILSVLTMFYGNIVALMQKNLKRMMAYSSISQAGYILIGIAVASQQGIAASLFQIFAHMFLFIGIMAIVAALESKNRNDIDDVIGLSGDNSFAAFALALFMLSLIGLPLTTGFVGKFLLFISAVNANLIWLAILGIVNTAISVFYYARVIMAMYAVKDEPKRFKMSRSIQAVVLLCVIVTVLFGIFPGAIVNMVNNSAQFLIP